MRREGADEQQDRRKGSKVATKLADMRNRFVLERKSEGHVHLFVFLMSNSRAVSETMARQASASHPASIFRSNIAYAWPSCFSSD